MEPNLNGNFKLKEYSVISEDDLLTADTLLQSLQSSRTEDNAESKAIPEQEIVQTEQTCFAEPLLNEKRDSVSKSRFAPKTEAKSKWAVNLFETWLKCRTDNYAERCDIRQVEPGNLLDFDNETLDYVLGAFLFEVRKENGDEYRGNTLYEIVVALQHHFRENGRRVKLLEDPEFEGMRCKLDKKMKDLAAAGVGIEKRQSNLISMKDEDSMWNQGILGSDTPEKLRDTLQYLLGLNFALRGGAEHYNLRHGENSQLRLGFDQQIGRRYLEYVEDISKFNPRGIHHRKAQRKTTKAYESVTEPDRCIVSLYEKYISLRYEYIVYHFYFITIV